MLTVVVVGRGVGLRAVIVIIMVDG
jgi:hypothetical protein